MRFVALFAHRRAALAVENVRVGAASRGAHHTHDDAEHHEHQPATSPRISNALRISNSLPGRSPAVPQWDMGLGLRERLTFDARKHIRKASPRTPDRALGSELPSTKKLESTHHEDSTLTIVQARNHCLAWRASRSRDDQMRVGEAKLQRSAEGLRPVGEGAPVTARRSTYRRRRSLSACRQPLIPPANAARVLEG
jgi:hypothetical protein